MSFRPCPEGTREKSCRFVASKDFSTPLRFGRNDTFFNVYKRFNIRIFVSSICHCRYRSIWGVQAIRPGIEYKPTTIHGFYAAIAGKHNFEMDILGDHVMSLSDETHARVSDYILRHRLYFPDLDTL